MAAQQEYIKAKIAYLQFNAWRVKAEKQLCCKLNKQRFPLYCLSSVAGVFPCSHAEAITSIHKLKIGFTVRAGQKTNETKLSKQISVGSVWIAPHRASQVGQAHKSGTAHFEQSLSGSWTVLPPPRSEQPKHRHLLLRGGGGVRGMHWNFTIVTTQNTLTKTAGKWGKTVGVTS